MMKKVVITGATSMIGVALIEWCIEEGIEVLAIVRPSSKNVNRLPESNLLSRIECDLSQLDLLPGTIMGETWDVFYHLGWGDTSKATRNDAQRQYENIGYTLAAVRLAFRLGCKRFIGAGSQAEYGRVDHVIYSYTPTNPDIAYGIAKDASGRLSRILCDSLGLEHIWARVFSVYGKWDNEGTMIRSALKSLLSHDIPRFTLSEQLWDYLYASDAGHAFVLLGEKGQKGKIYNIANGFARPLKEYIEIIRDSVDPNAVVQIGALPYLPQQVMHLSADIAELESDTGFVPQVSFEEGILRTITWLKKEGTKHE
jgi:UDP-glucose 4-epimerase